MAPLARTAARFSGWLTPTRTSVTSAALVFLVLLAMLNPSAANHDRCDPGYGGLNGRSDCSRMAPILVGVVVLASLAATCLVFAFCSGDDGPNPVGFCFCAFLSFPITILLPVMYVVTAGRDHGRKDLACSPGWSGDDCATMTPMLIATVVFACVAAAALLCLPLFNNDEEEPKMKSAVFCCSFIIVIVLVCIMFTGGGIGCDTSGWPDVRGSCSSCTVLVKNFEKYGTCGRYCASVGRRCTGAWEEDYNTCTKTTTMTCGEVKNTYDVLCECGEENESADSKEECDENTWPDIKRRCTTDCTVLVNNFDSKYRTCGTYCENIGRECIGAWDEDSDSCSPLQTMSCTGTRSTSDALCQCGKTLARGVDGPSCLPGAFASGRGSILMDPAYVEFQRGSNLRNAIGSSITEYLTWQGFVASFNSTPSPAFVVIPALASGRPTTTSRSTHVSSFQNYVRTGGTVLVASCGSSNNRQLLNELFDWSLRSSGGCTSVTKDPTAADDWGFSNSPTFMTPQGDCIDMSSLPSEATAVYYRNGETSVWLWKAMLGRVVGLSHEFVGSLGLQAAGWQTIVRNLTIYSSCTNCPPGKYLASENASSCTDCNAGKYSAMIAANASGVCLSCSPGLYSGRGASNCSGVPCPVGQYAVAEAASAQQASCTKCAAGKRTSSVSGATSCVDCAAGEYATSDGSTDCTLCQAGTYQDGVSKTGCLLCGAGSYSPSPGASSCLSCDFGQFAASGSWACQPCDAPPGSVCPAGSTTQKGVVCPFHVSCPGGNSGPTPTAVVATGAVSALTGAVTVAYTFIFESLDYSCSVCQGRCSSPLLQTFKLRAGVVFAWPASSLATGILAAFAPPWLSPDYHSLLIIAASMGVLVSFVAAALIPRAFKTWVNRPVCCLCKGGGNKIYDIEANNSICTNCKTRYEGMHRAPAGVIAYDEQAALGIIVGVETRLALIRSVFIPGLPTTKFEACSAAGGAADRLQHLLHQANVAALLRAIKDLSDLHTRMEASASSMLSGLACAALLTEAAKEQPDLSVDLHSQSMEALEERRGSLKASETAAVAEGRYDVAAECVGKHAAMTQALYAYKAFQSGILVPLRACLVDIRVETERLGEYATQAETVQKSLHAFVKEADEAAGALASEMDKVTSLADQEGSSLQWLTASELDGLKGAATAASSQIKKSEESTSAFVMHLYQAEELWEEVSCGRKASKEMHDEMQRLVSDTACRPSEILSKIRQMPTQPCSVLLEKMIAHLPKGKIGELEEHATARVDAINLATKPIIELLRRAPVLPQGISLNEATGEIVAKPNLAMAEIAFTVRAFNDSGECASAVLLSAKGQLPPRGLSYCEPAASEFASPPNSTGLLLVGTDTSLIAVFEDGGTPSATFTVLPALPDGLLLNHETGEVHGVPTKVSARREYIFTLRNLAGETTWSLPLEVQCHTPPSPLEYDEALRPDRKPHKIFKIEEYDHILPVTVDTQENLRFSISPALPSGMKFDDKRGIITVTPSVTIGRMLFTIVCFNLQGQQSAEIAFAVAGDWQISHPKDWTIEMTLMWLKEELNIGEDDQAHFVELDGAKLVTLTSKEAVASHYGVQPALQVLLSQSVKTLLGKWNVSNQDALLERPVGVRAGDDAKIDYMPYELRDKYVHKRVVGIGAYGVVVTADYVRNGHRKYQCAIKLVYAGQGSKGFSDKALRRLEREATILSRLNHQHIVRLLSFDVSARNDVFWLVMEHLEGSSLDVVMQDPDMSFSEDGLIRLAQQILSALHALHLENIIHRDIKPGNIVMLNGTFTFKIIDLGVAAVVSMRDEEIGQSLMSQGTVLNIAGTHGFMPPETYMARDKLGAHSDVWSFAVTLFYLASRRMPFEADDEFRWMFVIAGNLEDQAPKLADVCSVISPQFSNIVAKGLQKKIEYRYSDAMEMKQDCEALLNQGNHDLGAQIVSERQHWVSEGQRGLDDSKLFAVSASTEEYAQVSARFLASMPNATIVSVERVENGPMHEAFLLQASTLKKQIGADWDQDAMRKMLFHGTDAVEQIINSADGHGFLPLLAGTSTGAIYGDGTYFASTARYSHGGYVKSLPSGRKQVFLVDVLVGRSAQGRRGVKMCPFLPGQRYARYNSLVDDMNNGSIFVVQHSNQAYPSYLITYTA